MSRLFKPPKYIKDNKTPLIFLAGPIQSAVDWQVKAIRILQKKNGILIANPRRNVKFEKDFSQKLYNEQVDWETHHLNRAGKNGVILFWLANESKHDCKRAYAQTTRFELAEWIMKHKYEGANVVVGIDDKFTGARYIKYRILKEFPEIPVLYHLKETCEKAVEIALKKGDRTSQHKRR